MVRSSASGSASFTATRHRAYRIGTPRGEWQCDRYARGRVAVHPTLPLGGERTGRRIPHCHSASSVPRRHDQGRVAVRSVRSGASGSATLNLRGSRRGSQEGSRRGSQLQANDKGRPRVLRDLPPLDHTSARQASLPCARQAPLRLTLPDSATPMPQEQYPPCCRAALPRSKAP